MRKCIKLISKNDKNEYKQIKNRNGKNHKNGMVEKGGLPFSKNGKRS